MINWTKKKECKLQQIREICGYKYNRWLIAALYKEQLWSLYLRSVSFTIAPCSRKQYAWIGLFTVTNRKYCLWNPYFKTEGWKLPTRWVLGKLIVRIGVECNWVWIMSFADFSAAFGLSNKNVGYFKIFHGRNYLLYVFALLINLNYWQ
jgi:hypothetical protein